MKCFHTPNCNCFSSQLHFRIASRCFSSFTINTLNQATQNHMKLNTLIFCNLPITNIQVLFIFALTLHEEILRNRNKHRLEFISTLMSVTFLKLKMAHLTHICLFLRHLSFSYLNAQVNLKLFTMGGDVGSMQMKVLYVTEHILAFSVTNNIKWLLLGES